MENRKVYYDKNYNRFFGFIKEYPRTYLTTSLHGFYDTAKNGDTFRYSIPKSYLKNCVLVENPENPFSEKDTYSYKIKGYDCLHDTEPKIDHKIFKWNNFAHKIAQYQWDKKNDFWKFEREMMRDYDDFEDYDTNTLDSNE